MPTPFRALVLVVTAFAALGPLGAPAGAAVDPAAEQRFVALLNQERAAAGVPAVRVATDLTAAARRHSDRMADAQSLHHSPDLGGSVQGWQKLGENVGRGPTVASIHQALVASPGHRRNMLDSDFTQVGVGVEFRDDTVWVTQIFRTPAPAPAPATTSPEPRPAPAPQATTAPAPAAPAARPATAAPPAPPATPSWGRRGPVMLRRLQQVDAASTPAGIPAA